jgi:hypothetical protein
MGGGGGGVAVSPGERMQADLAQQQWNDYKKNYQPLDKQIVARAKNKDRGRTLGINMAAGGAGQAYGIAERRALSSMNRRGSNPNSGNYMMGLNGEKRAAGAGIAKAGVGSNIAADKRYAGQMFNAIAHGRGVKGIGVDGIGATARLSNQRSLAESQYRSAERAATMSAVGTIAGVGAYGVARVTAPGANGAASGWDAYSQARDAGAGFGESFGIMRGQMAANRSN